MVTPTGKPYVAIDTVDAGVGDLVLTCAGSSARQTTTDQGLPGGCGHHGCDRHFGS